MQIITTPSPQPPHIDLDNAYEHHPDRGRKTFAQMFIEKANPQLVRIGIPPFNAFNCAPIMVVAEHIQAQYRKDLERYSKPWIMFNGRSNSWANRSLPDETWTAVSKETFGTCFWVGMDKAPEGFIDLNVRHVDTLVRYLSLATVAVTPDTGPLHIAAALGIPCVSIEQASSPQLHISEQRDYITVATDHLTCLNCQKNICPIHAQEPPCQKIDPMKIVHAIHGRLAPLFDDSVSAVICVWKPDMFRLNKCLARLLPQVNEIVISIDGDGHMPKGILLHPNILYAPNWSGQRLGFGKTANRGVRHTTGKWILLLNDDVYLEGNTVAKLKEAADDKTGIVAGLLWYPNGTIQHGGTYRNPGDKGFGHIDVGARTHRFKQPLEMENVTLACALVRRKAFYQIMGFDEEYDVYCEDNDLCMKMRRAGYKIMYTPHAQAIHEEHQTTRKDPLLLRTIMRQSCDTFGRKWSWYFEKNANTIPGTFV